MYKPIIILFLIIYETLCTKTNQIPTSLDDILAELRSNPTTPSPPSRPSTSATPPTPRTPPSSDSSSTPAPRIASPQPEEENIPLPSPNEKYLNIGKNDKVGEYIADTRGLALYAFESDGTNESKCTGNCIETFRPLYVRSVTFPPVVDAKLDPKAVGLFERDDGKYQASYNKVPLYLYKLDKRQGDIKGHKLKEFGGIWSLIAPSGSILDSRAGGLLKNLTNIQTMNFYSTGISSMVVIPDLYVMELNVTASQPTLSAAVKSLTDSLQTFNNIANNPVVTLTNKSVKQSGQNFDVNYLYKTVAKDPQAFTTILSAANQIYPNNFQIQFGVSDDLFFNSKNVLYEMAVIDATQNANSLLSNFNLQVDAKNPIRNINIDFINIQSINPVLTQSTLSFLPSFETATPNVATLKAEINFNIIKSTS